MSSHDTSFFEDEPASVAAGIDSSVIDHGILDPYDEYYVDPRLLRRPCYNRRTWLIGATTCIVLIVVAAMTTAVVVGIGGTRNIVNAGSASDPETAAPSPAPTRAKMTAAPALELSKRPTASPTVKPTVFERTSPLAFYVMGDTPYNDWELGILIDQLHDMTDNLHPGAAFAVHVGDMMKAQMTLCVPRAFTGVRSVLGQSPLPMFVIAGDNDILDCPDRVSAWGNYTSHFAEPGFEQAWFLKYRESVPGNWVSVSNVERSDANPELFAFVEDGILFMSLNVMRMPDNEDEDEAFYERLATSKAWVEQQLAEKFVKYQVRGVVMFGHSLIHEGKVHEFFANDLKTVFADNNAKRPVLYFHGDGHKYNVDYGFGRAEDWIEFQHIQVDQGATADPLLIEVAPIKGGIVQPLVVENDLQVVLGNGLFRIDRQKGLYSDNELD